MSENEIKKRIRKNDTLELEGVYKEGYGIIPKLVMKDKKLSIEAKAIYALLCSYAGKGKTAFPSIESQCRSLKISEARYLRHRKFLIEEGYITITQSRDIIEYSDGRKSEVRGNNTYTIINDPQPLHANKKDVQNNKKSCKPQKSDVSLNTQIVSVENESKQNVCIDNLSKENELKQNEGTNNITTNNISSNNNTSISSTSNSSNLDLIDKETHLKLSAYQQKMVLGWEYSRLDKSIQIFNDQDGVYFSLLRKIYYDENNFIVREKKLKFNNFEPREYDYDELEKGLTGWMNKEEA